MTSPLDLLGGKERVLPPSIHPVVPPECLHPLCLCPQPLAVHHRIRLPARLHEREARETTAANEPRGIRFVARCARAVARGCAQPEAQRLACPFVLTATHGGDGEEPAQCAVEQCIAQDAVEELRVHDACAEGAARRGERERRCEGELREHREEELGWERTDARDGRGGQERELGEGTGGERRWGVGPAERVLVCISDGVAWDVHVWAHEHPRATVSKEGGHEGGFAEAILNGFGEMPLGLPATRENAPLLFLLQCGLYPVIFKVR